MFVIQCRGYTVRRLPVSNETLAQRAPYTAALIEIDRNGQCIDVVDLVIYDQPTLVPNYKRPKSWVIYYNITNSQYHKLPMDVKQALIKIGKQLYEQHRRRV